MPLRFGTTMTQKSPSPVGSPGLKVEIKEEGGAVNMCNAVREIIDDSKEEGRLAGLAEGEKKGIFESQLNMIRSLMDSLKCSLEDAFKWLKIPVSEQAACRAALLKA